MMYNDGLYVLNNGELLQKRIASLRRGHRLGCGLNLPTLPKVSICDLAHVENSL